MIYLMVFFCLFLLEIGYFKIANRFNIIDKPNERSSHSSIVLRGGGIIFWAGAFYYFIYSGFQYPWFFIGLTLMAFISMIDDIYTLSSRIRICVHFIAVLLMSFQLGLFHFPWYVFLISFILFVGAINAYNFMDGINGITACYSLSVGGLLLVVNREVEFIDQNLIIFVLLSVLVFAFFNFRNNAKCFAGDVGSVGISFILLFVLGSLIVSTGNIIYILFLLIYGIDTIWTLVSRLKNGENIFQAHRSHLYQYLANEARFDKLMIATLYGLLQFVLGILVIFVANQQISVQLIFSISLIVFLSAVYLIFKKYVVTTYVKS